LTPRMLALPPPLLPRRCPAEPLALLPEDGRYDDRSLFLCPYDDDEAFSIADGLVMVAKKREKSVNIPVSEAPRNKRERERRWPSVM